MTSYCMFRKQMFRLGGDGGMRLCLWGGVFLVHESGLP